MNKLNSSQGKQLREIAAYLKQKRIEQSLSLEQIASRTFIRLHILDALETGQVEELPELIYVQGFIRRYAEVLRIDGNSLAKQLTQTDNAVAAKTPPQPKPQAKPQVQPEPKPQPQPQLKIQPEPKPKPQPQPQPKPERAVATTEETSRQFLQRDEPLRKAKVEELVPASRPPQQTNAATRSVNKATSSARVTQSETTENLAFGRYWPLMAVLGCLGASLGLLYALTRSPAGEQVSKASLSETPLKSTVAKSPQATPINTSSSEIITKPDSEKPTISPSPVASPQTTAASPSPLPVASPQTTAASPSPLPVASPQTTAASPSPSPVASPQTTAASPSPSPVASPQTTGASPSPSPIASPSQATGPLSVAVALEGTSWLKVQVDGKTEYEGILEQGVKQNWTAKERLIIIAGNAGAVSYSVNQQPSQRLGEPGEVKEIQLTPTESNPTP